MTMSRNINARVSCLLAPGKLVFEEEIIDPASLAPGDVAVATEFSAISPGTELAAYSGAPPLRPGNPYPRLVGYCNCGRVISAGGDVEKIRAGDRVLTFASHRSHYRMPAKEIAALVPPALHGALASVTYLFHLGYAALLRAGAKAGDRVGVIGLGALGIAAVAMAREIGAHVIALSGREAALAKVRRLGAGETLKLDDPAVAEIGADIVVSTSNKWDDWLAALRAARRGGIIAVLGFPGREQPQPLFNPLDSQYFYDKHLTFMAAGHLIESDQSPEAGALVLHRNMAYLVDLISKDRLPAQEMACHILPAEELAKAYDDLLARRGDALTYVLRW